MIEELKEMYNLTKSNIENNHPIDFKELLYIQDLLNDSMGYPSGVGEKGVKENMLALIVEATEVLDEINWKPWKKNKKEVNREKFITEMTDILQFWSNAATVMNVSIEEISNSLRNKWLVNIKRIENGEVTIKK